MKNAIEEITTKLGDKVFNKSTEKYRAEVDSLATKICAERHMLAKLARTLSYALSTGDDMHRVLALAASSMKKIRKSKTTRSFRVAEGATALLLEELEEEGLLIVDRERVEFEGVWRTKVRVVYHVEIEADGKEVSLLEVRDTEKFSKASLYAKGNKISNKLKDVLELYNEQPLRILSLKEKELKTIVSLREDVRTSSRSEDPALKLHRFNGYIEEVISLNGEVLYGNTNLDGRLRARKWNHTNPLLNIYGESDATSMWRLPKEHPVTEEGYDHLRWSAVVLTNKKLSMKRAISFFRKNREKIMKALAESDSLYQRELGVVISKGIGARTDFRLWLDATNGGEQHMGMSFRSEQLMRSGNLWGGKEVVDSHGEIKNSFNKFFLKNATRKQIKKINQEVEHGSSIKSAIKKLNELYTELGSVVQITEEQLKSIYKDKLGETFQNIEKIVTYGLELASKGHFKVNWRTEIYSSLASHTSYIKSQEHRVHWRSPVTGKDKSFTITSDMPLERKTYGTGHELFTKEDCSGMSKVRGLLANITHSIDATVGWRTCEILMDIDVNVLFKHDNFGVHPSQAGKLKRAYAKAMLDVHTPANQYQKALLQIELSTGVKAPKLFTGGVDIKAHAFKDVESQPFLIA